ncbi:hypothetical protein JOQ06_006347 [Pogonophryne albipinna]|uniref:Uncharacterized protein n=1 Tax=Pogonophryne albipinna TaxID=1090488 RepID=A0AAD6FS57_9TELE|nr:hypothetical protein JOQ06_006347 [Pogonophryne albipinna]
MFQHIDDGNHMTALTPWAQSRHAHILTYNHVRVPVLPLGLQCWQRKALCCSQCADSVLEAVAAERLQSRAPREWPVLHPRRAGLVRGRTPSY